MSRTGEDILEEIGAVGNWANRGSCWCPKCEMWVEEKYWSGPYSTWQSSCEKCGTVWEDEDTGRGRIEDQNMERIQGIVDQYFAENGSFR
jgi:hypothetical protein